MAPKKKKPKSGLQAAAAQQKKARAVSAATGRGKPKKSGAKGGGDLEDPHAGDDLESVETGSVESDDAEHMTLDELYDAWAAGQLHGDILGALNSAPADPSTGLRWWQWVERERGVATHDPPLNEPRFMRNRAELGDSKPTAEAAYSAAPTLDELYDSWADGTLAANRLEALNSAPPDPATGLSWWQWVERSRGIELHDPPFDDPLFVRRENDPPGVVGGVDFGEHSLQASLQGLYDEWAQGRLSDETLESLRNAPPEPSSGLLWWQFIERARGIDAHDPPRTEPHFQRFPPVAPPESLRALTETLPPPDEPPPPPPTRPRPTPPPAAAPTGDEEQGGAGRSSMPSIAEDEERQLLPAVATPPRAAEQRGGWLDEDDQEDARFTPDAGADADADEFTDEFINRGSAPPVAPPDAPPIPPAAVDDKYPNVERVGYGAAAVVAAPFALVAAVVAAPFYLCYRAVDYASADGSEGARGASRPPAPAPPPVSAPPSWSFTSSSSSERAANDARASRGARSAVDSAAGSSWDDDDGAAGALVGFDDAEDSTQHRSGFKHYVELLGQLLNARLALERNLLVVVLSIVLALVWGRLVMDWPMDISLYFFMQTASTIGYGDFLPSSPSQRAWYTVYMWLVVGVVASSIGVIFEHVLRAQDESFESLDKKVSELVLKEKRDELRATESYRKKRAVTRDIVLKRRMRVNNLEIQRVWAQARYNCLELVVITAFGAFVMHFLQPDWPLATSIYWAVETFTTVGYGDVVPTTKLSRWFFIVFALFGTILFAKAVGYMLVLPNTLDKIKQDNHRLSQFNKGVNESMLDEFFAIDAAHGFLCDASRAGRKLSRAEFIVHVLVILERVTPHQVHDMQEIFEQLDVNGNQILDLDDARLFRQRQSTRDPINTCGCGRSTCGICRIYRAVNTAVVTSEPSARMPAPSPVTPPKPAAPSGASAAAVSDGALARQQQPVAQPPLERRTSADHLSELERKAAGGDAAPPPTAARMSRYGSLTSIFGKKTTASTSTDDVAAMGAEPPSTPSTPAPAAAPAPLALPRPPPAPPPPAPSARPRNPLSPPRALSPEERTSEWLKTIHALRTTAALQDDAGLAVMLGEQVLAERLATRGARREPVLEEGQQQPARLRIFRCPQCPACPRMPSLMPSAKVQRVCFGIVVALAVVCIAVWIVEKTSVHHLSGHKKAESVEVGGVARIGGDVAGGGGRVADEYDDDGNDGGGRQLGEANESTVLHRTTAAAAAAALALQAALGEDPA